MRKSLTYLFVLMLLSLISACGESLPSRTILDEISGVWRSEEGGELFKIVYANKKLSLVDKDRQLAVSVRDIDSENDTVNLDVELKDGGSDVWTLHQVRDEKKKDFKLKLTLHDGTQDELTFVRKISIDDLDKLADVPDNHSVTTLAGQLSVVEEEGGDKLFFNDKMLLDGKGDRLYLEKMFSFGDTAVVLLMSLSGGTACPGYHYFVTITPQGNTKLSNFFGTCSDLVKSEQNGQKIIITMPDMGGAGDVMYIYENGNVIEAKKKK